MKHALECIPYPLRPREVERQYKAIQDKKWTQHETTVATSGKRPRYIWKKAVEDLSSVRRIKKKNAVNVLTVSVDRFNNSIAFFIVATLAITKCYKYYDCFMLQVSGFELESRWILIEWRWIIKNDINFNKSWNEKKESLSEQKENIQHLEIQALLEKCLNF